MTTLRVLALSTGDNSSFHPGPALAPERIWQVLFNGAANLTTETGTDLGVRTDWRTLHPVATGPGKQGFEAIRRGVRDSLDLGSSVLCLGGDHAISYPAVAAHAERHRNLTIVHFDAHCDLYDAYDGNPYSHGSAFARIMENGHAKRLIQIGIRAATAHQLEQARRFGVEIYEACRWRDVFRSDIFDPHSADPLYLSLDLDVFDPAHAPGVSHHEPGGLTPREVFDVLHALPRIVGADLVELNPERDHADMTAALAAKCVKELLGLMLGD